MITKGHEAAFVYRPPKGIFLCLKYINHVSSLLGETFDDAKTIFFQIYCKLEKRERVFLFIFTGPLVLWYVCILNRILCDQFNVGCGSTVSGRVSALDIAWEEPRLIYG